ncbi:PAS domain-containing protein [Microvirga sp. HBU67558]|uniref:PAS domain-containing protein n=1 Tax=Microvirga TaxID=186650 RepID=UPI001B35AA20|nr:MULTISPECIES: PAS domain-containing protein [unclassified Microvirga]MBQ0822862.1 PAS domain-containing protein [Microvirga sp. HBU67558]
MNQPSFRTAATQVRLAEAIYRGMFEGAPHPYLILAPTLRIAGVNDAYMAATLRRRDALVGCDMFEAFPDNPLDDQATGVRNLGASFERALAHIRRDVMPLQRYDIRRPDGVWEVRYWSPVNWPIVDEAGSVIAIVHHVTDVTEHILAPKPQPGQESLLFRAERACLEARELVRQSQTNLGLARASAQSSARGSRD